MAFFGFIFKFLLWLFLFYLIYHALKSMFGSGSATLNKNAGNETKVKGKNQSNPPLDLSKRDVEDAVYHELKEGKKSG